MTQFTQKTFTVKTGARDPKDCDHQWQRVNHQTKRQECVQCGAVVPEVP
jgi:hypothetical protein